MISFESRLLEGVQAILGKDGLQAKHGLRYQKEQFEYAKRVAIGLARGNEDMASMTLLEAATGTGKTIGYAVPLALYAAYTGKRVGISTFTLQLQRQIFGGDMPVVSSMVFDYANKPITFARRIGLRNFISLSRLSEMIDSIGEKNFDEENRILLAALVDFAQSSIANKSYVTGEIAEFLEEYGLTSLPCGLKNEQICLTYDCHKKEQVGYFKHVAEAKNADIVITNHATTVIHSRRNFDVLDGDRPISSLVVDEADRFPDVAESMLSSALPVHYIKNLLSRFDHPSFVAAANAAESLCKHLSKVREDEKLDDVIFVDEHFPILSKEIKKFSSFLVGLEDKAAEITSDLDPLLREQMAELFVYCSRMKDMEKSFMIEMAGGLVPIISFSPSKKYPTLALRPANPGFYLSRLWTPRRVSYDEPDAGYSLYLESCLMTSATLGDPSLQNIDRRFSAFMAGCGIYDSISLIDEEGKKNGKKQVLRINHDLFSSFEPVLFGRMSFVLADPRLPKPLMKIDEEEDAISDTLTLTSMIPHPIWLDYVCNTIVFAAKENRGRTLVLTNSHRDTDLISSRLIDAHVKAPIGTLLVHKGGQKLGDLKIAYKQSADPILITAGGWEGLDLSSKDMHSVDNLIITRLPYGGKDGVKNRVFTRWLMQYRGKTRSESAGILMAMYRSAAHRKMMQALGRGIRKMSDRCTVYITDPRFPALDHPETKRFFGNASLIGEKMVRGDVAFHKSVPSRFSLDDAKILCVDGNLFDRLTSSHGN